MGLYNPRGRVGDSQLVLNPGLQPGDHNRPSCLASERRFVVEEQNLLPGTTAYYTSY